MKSAGDAHRPTQRSEAKFFSCRSLNGLANCGAQPDNIHEVVEVPGLQRGILPVIREAKKLLIAQTIAKFCHPRENGESGNARRRAAAFSAKLTELGGILRLSVGHQSRSRIKQQRCSHEPALHPAFAGFVRTIAVRIVINALRHPCLVFLLHADLPGGIHVQPRIGQEFEVSFGIPQVGIWNEITPRDVIFLVLGRIKCSWHQLASCRVFRDAKECFAGVTTENCWKQWSVWLAYDMIPCLQRNVPFCTTV